MYNGLKTDSVSKNESSVNLYWEEIDLLKKSITARENCDDFIFYEGPPTANGKPGVHHVIARALKDAICRYKTMQGFKVGRKAGWDTHGLPVEIEVEKRLGLGSKQAIEEYGIEKFNKACRDSVFEYEALWREMTTKMGYLIDMNDPYITLDDNFIETEWHILKDFFEAGLIYEGHKILPYCSRCGTGLASHEVALGYQEIKSNTVYVKFKAVDEDAYFLVWTTTPWTLASNVALTVNPNEIYLKLKSDGVVYYIQKNLATKMFEENFEVISEHTGRELEFKKYHQLMPFVKADKEAFYVTCADYVTVEDGTGIVHTAPAFGEDDYQTGRRYNLPVLKPVDETGKYTDTIWAGRSVLDKELEIDIIKWLDAQGSLFKKQAMMHNYPHCWRCSTPLLYYAKPSWYIEMTKLKDQMVAANNTVNWFPSFIGEKRFGNWLENINDWAISRSRYWGTPLNIWRCDCGDIDSIGSRKELVERANESIDETIELHRPYVDDVTINCKKCNGVMRRVPDVIDCWFDSGSMPYAQWHFPFEHKDDFDKLFPADFICEGIDQTRGWFYSLMAISVFYKGVAPYKNVLVNDLLLDKEGKKMSKSRGNAIDPFELLEKYGADATRWYMYYNSPVWQPTKFDEEGVKDIGLKFFSSLKNIYSFFTMYANADGLNVKEFAIEPQNRAEIDRWLISKLNKLVAGVQADLDVYDMTKASRKIHEFVLEDFSNWYIRRNRRRFWASELTDDKKAVYQTTYEAILCVCKLVAPMAPFLVEEIYRNLSGGVSIHIERYPISDPKLIDEHVEHRMDLVRDLVSIGRATREAVKIKVRQPLSKMLVDGSHRSLISDLEDLMKEELNVKEVVFEDHLDNYMNFSLKPNFASVGKMLGKRMGAYTKALSGLNAHEWAVKLKNGEILNLELDGEKFEFDASHVQVNIHAKEGFTVDMKDNLFVILDTTLTKELVDEGYAREVISKIQQLRKEKDLNVLDRIEVKFNGDDEVKSAFNSFDDYIKKEVLADSFEFAEIPEALEYDINGRAVRVEIQKR